MPIYQPRSQVNGALRPTGSGTTPSVTALKAPVLEVTVSKPSIKNASAQALSILSSAEVRELVACEDMIAKGWDTFIAVGHALAEIRKKRLYRADYDTFEAYCRQKWRYGKSQAYRLMGAAEVIQHLSPIGDIPLPRNESQVRPLLGLKPEQVKVVWCEAVQKAGRESITAKLVKQMAAQFTAQKAVSKTATKKPPTAAEIEASLVAAEGQIMKARQAFKLGDNDAVVATLIQLGRSLWSATSRS